MNLLTELNNLVKPTNLTRKLTINGETKIYPVYKINISLLFYNDQNDRIASWISQYKEENGQLSLETKSIEEYNNIIEKFVISSNPQSITKTANNIKLIGQREPGVVLKDGRIIDGNRRYTCIRQLFKNDSNTCWFESVILDIDLNDNKKMIKMLELTIQHGEEKRVDYNREEILIGIYHDIVETKLLTIDEYAKSTNESVNEIAKKVAASKILADYLEYIGMPKQFFVAREYQLVSLISDAQELLKRCINQEMVDKLKRIIFVNQLMNSFSDERKFIKNIASLITNGQYFAYEDNQLKIEEKVLARKNMVNPSSLSEIKAFVAENDDLTMELKESMDKYLNNSKIVEVHNKPAQTITKTLISLKDVDTNIVAKLSPVEKTKLVNQLSHLNEVIDTISEAADYHKTVVNQEEQLEIVTDVKKGTSFINLPSTLEEQVMIENIVLPIRGLIFTFDINNKLENSIDYKLYFINENGEILSNVIETPLNKNSRHLTFELSSKVSEENVIDLVVKKNVDAENEVRFMFDFPVKVEFGGEFDF